MPKLLNVKLMKYFLALSDSRKSVCRVAVSERFRSRPTSVFKSDRSRLGMMREMSCKLNSLPNAKSA